MRLPKEAQLSGEQKEVCFAATDGTTLVVGPPGSGKTVVALYRARMLEKQGQKADLAVYNHVLRRFTDSGHTFYKWLSGWWRRATGRSFPYAYEERPDGRGSQRVWDFDAAMTEAKTGAKDALRTKGDWGQLILDEAQDFSPKAHQLLFTVQNVVYADADEEDRPSLMILADENQRLSSGNSSISEIRESHMLTADETYELRRNYRNSREIAEFSQQFYVGLPSGKPGLPEQRGEKPMIVLTESLDASVDRIIRFARTHEDQEMGVLMHFDRTRKKFFNKLSHRLRDTNIRVQTYGSQDKDHKDASKLAFDQPGTITVLCFASAKGLEFDSVFLPELQTMPVDAENRDDARMRLYVMCSRARHALFLLATDPGRSGNFWRILPDTPNLYRIEG